MCTHTHLGVRKQVSVHAYIEHFGRKPNHKKSPSLPALSLLSLAPRLLVCAYTYTESNDSIVYRTDATSYGLISVYLRSLVTHHPLCVVLSMSQGLNIVILVFHFQCRI